MYTGGFKMEAESDEDTRLWVAYKGNFDSLLRAQPGSKRLTGAGEIVIVLGGILAYFFDPAWLALSILGLSWAGEGRDTNTRASVVALITCINMVDQRLRRR
jgi:hypothetical protein